MTNNFYEEQECPYCGEFLVFHKEGVMKNEKTGEMIYVFMCEECNQAFGIDEEKKRILPYDANMKLIENKCERCGKIENFNEKGLFLLNVDSGYYDFHCMDCAKLILQDWIDKNGKEKVEVTDKNIYEIYEIYDFQKNNEMIKEMDKNPDKYKKVLRDVEKILNQSKEEENGDN